MARPYGTRRATCESCISIDVRRWHRERRLHAGQYFSCSWTCGGEPSGNIGVRSEADAVSLLYRSRRWGIQSGNRSSSACQLHGPRATWVAAVPGSSVPSTRVADTADAAWRFSTALAHCLRAAAATA